MIEITFYFGLFQSFLWSLSPRKGRFEYALYLSNSLHPWLDFIPVLHILPMVLFYLLHSSLQSLLLIFHQSLIQLQLEFLTELSSILLKGLHQGHQFLNGLLELLLEVGDRRGWTEVGSELFIDLFCLALLHLVYYKLLMRNLNIYVILTIVIWSSLYIL